MPPLFVNIFGNNVAITTHTHTSTAKRLPGAAEAARKPSNEDEAMFLGGGGKRRAGAWPGGG